MAIDLKNISEYFQYPSKVTELRGRLYKILRDKGIGVAADESLNSLIEKVRTVEPAILPQTIYITENNTTYDVTEYTDAVVNVPVETIANDLDGLVDGSLSSFTMPSQISTLAFMRFSDFTDLSEVSMPQVKGIPDSTFCNCYKLSEINIPEANNIGYYAFNNCYTLNVIEAPKANYLGQGAFYNCFNLTEFSNKNIDTIQSATFINNYKLSYLSLPNVRELNGSPFTNCYNLSEVNLPNLVLIGNNAFTSDNKLSNLQSVNLPKLTITYSPLPYNQTNTILDLGNLESIYINSGSHFISNYSNLTSVNLSNLNYISGGLIRDCSNITSITLSNLRNGNAGGYYLISNLQNLSYLDINNLSSIANYTLVSSCPNLSEIKMTAWTGSIYLPSTKISQLIAPSATGVNAMGLFNCSNLQYADIRTASYISNNAFDGCINLSKVEAYNLNKIGVLAFNSCINLESITLYPSYSTSESYSFSLQDYAFNNCNKLSAVYLQTSSIYTNIRENVFTGTPILNSDYLGHYGSIYVHPDVLSSYISAYLSTRLANRFTSFSEEYLQDNIIAEQFKNKNTMTEIPESLINAKVVNTRAFYSCTALSSIYLPKAEIIGNSAFWAYSGSKSVSLPECLYIGNSAFYVERSYNTYNVNIPKCTTIADKAFSPWYYNNYLYINCPEVETIGNSALSSLSILWFSNSTFSKLKSIGAYGLASHSTLTFTASYINFPELTYLGAYAFYYARTIRAYNSSTGTYRSVTLDFPNLETINEGAFQEVYGSLYINLSKVKNIHSNAFYQCSVRDIGNTYDIEYIGNSAFYRCYYLSTIFSSPKLRYIGDSAFRECSSITKMDFPECLKVGTYCFAYDDGLIELNLPKIATLRPNLFYACRNLSSLTLDFSRITSIPEQCFYNCSNLSELNMPNVYSLSSSAFMYCYNLSKLVLGDITKLPLNVFAFCSKLNFDSINLSNLISIENGALWGCSSLSEIYNEKLVSLPANVLSGCINLSKAYLPNVKYLSNGIFYNCRNLSDLTLDFNNIEYINSSAFYDCRNLSSFETSPNISVIEASAFAYCSNLTEFSLQNLSVVASNTFMYCTNLSSINLENIEIINNYAFQENTNLTYIGNTSKLKQIGATAFEKCINLSTINLEAVESLGPNAFAGCYSLNTTLPNISIIEDTTFYATGLTNISNSTLIRVGNQAFAYCSSLRTVNLEKVEYLSANAFSNCKNLTEFIAPNLNSLSQYAFAQTGLSQIPNDVANNISSYPFGLFTSCYNLVSINNIANLNYVGEWTFAYCYSLNYVKLSGCTSIGNNAFYSCTGLETVDLPEITNLSSGYINTGTTWSWLPSNRSIFKNCSSIKYINLPKCSQLYGNITSPVLTSVNLNSLEVLETDIFKNATSLVYINLNNLQRMSANLSACTTLSSIYLPKIKELPDNAFTNCYSLAEINIPNLTVAGSSAFQNCSSLAVLSAKYLYLSGSLYTFSNCINLETFDVPVIENVYDSTFYNCNKLKSVNLGVGLISSSTFKMCSNLSQLNLLNTVDIVSGLYNCLSQTPIINSSLLGYYGSIYVPSKALSYYTSRWSAYSARFASLSEYFDSNYIYANEYNNSSVNFADVRSNIKYILGNAFYTTKFLDTTELSFNNVKFIGPKAFYGTNITSINLPQVEGILSGAFSYCSSLVNISIPNCKYIGANAFSSCKLRSISLTGVDTIKNYAFAYCSSLSEIYTDAKIIDSNAFWGCSNIEVIDLPNCYSLGEANFGGYYSSRHVGKVRYVNIPNLSIITCPGRSNSYGTFASSTFSSTMDYVNLGFSSWYISWELFNNKTINSMVLSNISNITFSIGSCSISQLELPKCTYISNYAFSGTTIQSLILPSSISVGEYAFQYANIPTLDLVVSNTVLPRYAFQYAKLSTVRMTDMINAYDDYATFGYLNAKTVICDKFSFWGTNGRYSVFQSCQVTNLVFNASQISIYGYSQFSNNNKLDRLVFKGDLVYYYNGYYQGDSYLFYNTPITNSAYLGHFGSIYVPRSYLANWLTKWSYYASRITTIEEHEDELRNEGLID